VNTGHLAVSNVQMKEGLAMRASDGAMLLRTLSWAVVACAVSICGAARAERPKVIAIADVTAEGVDAAPESLARLTDAVYAAATAAPRDLFSVISREKLASGLAAASDGGGPRGPARVGAIAGADLVFTGVLRRPGAAGLEVTLTLVETVSGRVLGLEKAEAAELGALWAKLREVATAMLAPEAGEEGAPGIDVRIRARPEEAAIELDGRVVCPETPCAIHVAEGAHTFEASADLFVAEERRVAVERPIDLSFELKPRRYTYFGMHDADQGGTAISFGASPVEPRYRSITAFDGFTLAGLNPVCDVGFGGQVFGYRQAPRGDSWSILGFGPVVRFGRLIVGADVQLLSFRPRSPEGGGWLPGISARAQIPLVNRREIGGWAVLIPMPTAGVDVWFHELDYDQYQVWLGLSWLGGIGF
jgi:hypothetical protein